MPTLTLECMSLQTVRHHLQHDALRMEPDFVCDTEWFQPHPSIRACIATPASDPRTVVGMTIYRLEDEALHFASVRVSEAYRRQGVAKRLLAEVIKHPANMLVRRIIWPATSAGGEALIRHLRWLGSHADRICGTGFTVEVEAHPRSRPPAPG